ncbi:major facilitator superfamily domain-containing protein [Penicillium argentinense]|uniref:Major facilitator superfamily domain-containing protein n=1 Tax=Penicillium argentinense TaxID=1131581 RepID=A0A9W9JXX8_9EURO|nr:major facilitator superfamily domain-containing protein [Penicillium argentinense]KAJ5085994.1 major facilitator superfamily domain-containing protein [Penicillium argentinense]
MARGPGSVDRLVQQLQLDKLRWSLSSILPVSSTARQIGKYGNMDTSNVFFRDGPFVGRLFDRFGPKYLLLAGTFLHVFGLMMASVAMEHYQSMLSQAICSPLGESMTLYPCLSCVTTRFQKRDAYLAMGITVAISRLGGVFMPILVEWLIRLVGVWEYLGQDTDLPFVLLIRASFCYSMGMLIPITFTVNYEEYVGLSNCMAGYLVANLMGARLGNFNISISAAFLSTVLFFALCLPGHSGATAIASSAVFGLSTGTYTAISPAPVAQISNLGEIGTRSGLVYAFISIAPLTGSPIGGALISLPREGVIRSYRSSLKRCWLLGLSFTLWLEFTWGKVGYGSNIYHERTHGSLEPQKMGIK